MPRAIYSLGAQFFWLGLLVSPVAAQVGGAAPSASLGQLSEAFEELTARVSPAVVQIFTAAYGPLTSGEGAGGVIGRQRRGGSGVLLSSDGYIVTNAHVVEGARRLQILLSIPAIPEATSQSILKPVGKRADARIVGIDWETDLAVLKIEGSDLPHLPLGDSDAVQPGQLVLAFGNPLGLENTVTMGVVSAVARQLRLEDPMVYVQTDAPTNPGNSGGPLINADGEVIGINTLILSQSGGSEGIGFAAPSNIVRNVYEQIRDSGRVRRGEIGVFAQTITPTVAAGLGLIREWGVILGDVDPGSPALRAGLQVGDVITSLNGKPMENGRQFDVNLYNSPIGSTVTLEVRRGLNRMSVIVPVVERRDDPGRLFEFVSPERNLIGELGVLAVQIDRRVAAMLPYLRTQQGVVVVARAVGARSQRDGLRPGDAIHAINGVPIRTLADVRAILTQMKTGDAVVFLVNRRGKGMFVGFEYE
ncbi:MAG: PDZ domain-containing protein [Gemmatimonadales bacterium]|nr:PDZ domain-containing protein [Gemmatimonadales bacterium]